MITKYLPDRWDYRMKSRICQKWNKANQATAAKASEKGEDMSEGGGGAGKVWLKLLVGHRQPLIERPSPHWPDNKVIAPSVRRPIASKENQCSAIARG